MAKLNGNKSLLLIKIIQNYQLYQKFGMKLLLWLKLGRSLVWVGQTAILSHAWPVTDLCK